MSVISKFTILMFISIICLCCTARKENEKNLCLSFYALNKRTDFSKLYDVAIDDRFDNQFNTNTQQNTLTFDHLYIYDQDSSKYQYVPVFKRGASLNEKKTAYKKGGLILKNFLSQKLKATSNGNLEQQYISYIDSVISAYYAIKTPPAHNNENVKVVGNPGLGKFILFKLNDKVNCYYVLEKQSLTDYWSKFFNDSRKIDEHWYYEVKY